MSKPKAKVFSYFLFMQEQRQLVPGWANKSNNELQALCDPLWRRLDKEEKEKYKKLKKAYREKERLEEGQRFVLIMQVDIRTKVVVGQVDKPDIVWVTKVKEMEEVQKQLAKIAMVPLERLEVGTVAACKYSVDGEVYRCQVVAMGEEEDMVMVRYMEFGNLEKVKKIELCHLPSILSKMGPLAVKVKVAGMEGVKDTEKNRAKVEKKLGIEELEVSLNKKGFAIFYEYDKLIAFKGSKIKDESVKLLDNGQNLIQKLEEEGESSVQRKEDVVKLKQTFVTEVVRGALEAGVEVKEPVKQERVAEQVENMEAQKTTSEAGINLKDILDVQNKIFIDDDDTELTSSVETSVVDESLADGIYNIVDKNKKSPEEDTEADCDGTAAAAEALDDCNDNLDKQNKRSVDDTKVTPVDKTVAVAEFDCNIGKKFSDDDTDTASGDVASIAGKIVADCNENFDNHKKKSPEEASLALADEIVANMNDIFGKQRKKSSADATPVAIEVVADCNKQSNTPAGEVTEGVLDKSMKNLADDKSCEHSGMHKRDGFTNKQVFDSSSKGRTKMGKLVKKKKKNNLLNIRKNSSGWEVGDAVVARWAEDGVWRQGTVHEIVGDMAYVVSKEQLVRAARVRLDQLRHSAMPVEVLNMMEEEFVRDWEEKSSFESSTEFSSSVPEEVGEEVHDGVLHKDQFKDELEDLLALLPSVDITTLTSPSCSDLLATLVMLIPSLSTSQLDRLVGGMIRQDLLVTAALHPSGYLLARQLVKHVMLANSDMKVEVFNCLAKQADKMQMNKWGREVLKTLEGFI